MFVYLEIEVLCDMFVDLSALHLYTSLVALISDPVFSLLSIRYSRVPSGTWKPGKPGDLNFICPGPEIVWNLSQKVRKPGQSKKFRRKKPLDKTWNVKIYNISMLYSGNFSQMLYCCDFRTSLVSSFWCHNCPHYNLENGCMTWIKPGHNLEFYC